MVQSIEAIRDSLERTVCIANGKGGVGKSSVTSNVAGMAAEAGWKVLLIDLDPQGNIGDDLGYKGTATDDDGLALSESLSHAKPLVPVANVRPDLDVVIGGEHLDDLESVLVGRITKGNTTHDRLARALAPIADDYDIILIDTPPTRPAILQVALGATRWLIVPTKSDRSSITGLATLARQMSNVISTNPRIEILGTLLFGVNVSAKNVRKNALQDIEDILGGAAPVFETVIRHAEATASQARYDGKLVHEMAADLEGAEPFWKALKEGRRPERTTPGSATKLADDYGDLAAEVIGELTRREDLNAEGATA